MQGAYILVKTEDQRKTALEEIAQKPIGPKGFYLQIKDGAAKRSVLANAYLWGWVYSSISGALEAAGIAIATTTGEHPYTKDVLHEIFRTKFLQIGEIQSKKGRVLPIYKSTTALNSSEFSEYVDNVKKFTYQFWGVQVPAPTRGIWFDYYKQLGLG